MGQARQKLTKDTLAATRYRVIVFVVAVSILAASCAEFGEGSKTDTAWFTEHGVTFVYPDEWESFLEEYVPSPPCWGVLLTPDKSSGNLLAFYYYPSSSAADLDATHDEFYSELDGLLGGGTTLRHGPTVTTIAGLPGREFGLAGTLYRSGDPFESEVVMFYSEEAAYVLQVQYEPGSEDIMLSAWQTMLSNFDISQ